MENLFKQLRSTNSLQPHSIDDAFQFQKSGFYKTISEENLTIEDEKWIIWTKSFAYITRIEMIVSEMNDSGHFLTYQNVAGDFRKNPHTNTKKRIGKTIVEWDINEVVSDVYISKSDIDFSSVEIRIHGKKLSSINSLLEELISREIDLVSDSKNFSNQVRELENKVYNLNLDLVHLQTAIDTINKEIEEGSFNLENLKKEEEEKSNEVNNLNFKLVDLKSNFSSKERENKSLESILDQKNEKISKANNNLEIINAEIVAMEKKRGQYSEDFDTYKKEINLQNLLFLSIFVFALIISSAVLYKLIDSSYNLATNFDKNINIYHLLISRTPTVLLYVGLLMIASRMLIVFYNLLSRNLSELKDLKKVVYLVSCISDSQSSGLVGISNQEIYKTRVREKMNIVRDLFNLDISKTEEEKELNRESDAEVSKIIDLIKNSLKIK
ncbi:hypothetical protein [Vibrio owensii]|uniref:hypothetical protein n=1 Tax=Vibrio owensii TaxID=696485 RepID=UPI0018F119F6|nr:hypothetical protein [Vibrio owensii]